jgi:hypothetical protein
LSCQLAGQALFFDDHFINLHVTNPRLFRQSLSPITLSSRSFHVMETNLSQQVVTAGVEQDGLSIPVITIK